jgi:hypothetical protein
MTYDDGDARCQVDARFARKICELISVSANALPDFRRLRTLTKGKPSFTEKKKPRYNSLKQKNGGHLKGGRQAVIHQEEKAGCNSLKTKKWRAFEEGGDSPMPACS